jgi:hypothetical protein
MLSTETLSSVVCCWAMFSLPWIMNLTDFLRMFLGLLGPCSVRSNRRAGSRLPISFLGETPAVTAGHLLHVRERNPM